MSVERASVPSPAPHQSSFLPFPVRTVYRVEGNRLLSETLVIASEMSTVVAWPRAALLNHPTTVPSNALTVTGTSQAGQATVTHHHSSFPLISSAEPPGCDEEKGLREVTPHTRSHSWPAVRDSSPGLYLGQSRSHLDLADVHWAPTMCQGPGH